MNAKFSDGPKGELIALSGGYLGKDEVVRPATDEDRALYGEEYAEFKKSLDPKAQVEAKEAQLAALQKELAALKGEASPPVSAGASPDAAAAGAAAAGAGDTKPPSAG